MIRTALAKTSLVAAAAAAQLLVIAPAPAGAQAATGGVYASPTYGYELAYGAAWEVVGGVSDEYGDSLHLSNETSTMLFVGTGAFGGDVDACVAGTIEAITSGPPFGDLALATDVEGNPMAGSDADSAFAVYDYAYTNEDGTREAWTLDTECVTLVPGGATLAIVQNVPDAAYNDELAARDALVAGLTLSAVAAAQVAVTDAYVSPTYGYALAIDGAAWEVAAATSEADYDVLELGNGVSTVVLEGAPNRAVDPAACVQAEFDRLGQRRDVADLSLVAEEPVRIGAWDGASLLYRYTLAGGAAGTRELAARKWCGIIQPGATLVVTQIVPVASFTDQLAAGSALLGGLQPPAAAGATGGPTGPTGEAAGGSDLAEFVDSIAADLDAFWTEEFASQGLYYVEPLYLLVDGPVPSTCDSAAFQPGDGTAYCSAEQVVYVDPIMTQAHLAEAGPAAAMTVLAHEWGHHAEMQLGLLGEQEDREAELVADCLAGAYVADARDRGLVDQATVDGLLPFVGGGGGDGHGLGSQRAMMFLRGLSLGVGGCLA